MNCVSCRKPVLRSPCSMKCMVHAWIHSVVGMKVPPLPGTRYSGVRTSKHGRCCQAKIRSSGKRCDARAIKRDPGGRYVCPWHSLAFRRARAKESRERPR